MVHSVSRIVLLGLVLILARAELHVSPPLRGGQPSLWHDAGWLSEWDSHDVEVTTSDARFQRVLTMATSQGGLLLAIMFAPFFFALISGGKGSLGSLLLQDVASSSADQKKASSSTGSFSWESVPLIDGELVDVEAGHDEQAEAACHDEQAEVVCCHWCGKPCEDWRRDLRMPCHSCLAP
eukprot:gnl/TRDRNA2_/TRDRNA2_178730_c0_seq1.p1 gnl/TRDRNA2_/TRDRNA2_178730_c0~~gnl/TRDRNA2_/TRDRNA2_178730_c0_seq1.p1  ORF type:complete len:180 (+),score=33.35 gnl/TRDRNA2_/TRDRNA2_178730_c0_seq1:96-635(+)